MSKKIKQDLSIGGNLRCLRQAAGYTQEQVVAKLQTQGFDISREMLSQMENGRYSIRVSILIALKVLYAVPSYDAFFDNL